MLKMERMLKKKKKIGAKIHQQIRLKQKTQNRA